MATPIPRWQGKSAPTSSHKDETFGLAGKLAQCCVKLLACLLAHTKHVLSEEDYYRLRTETQRLSLWCDGFVVGGRGLDNMISGSKHLKAPLYRLLNAFGKSLVHMAGESVPDGVDEESASDLKKARNDLGDLLDRSSAVTHSPEIGGIGSDDDDVNTEEESSNQMKDLIDDITLYNDLLVDFGPALEIPAKTGDYEGESDALEDAVTQKNVQRQKRPDLAITFSGSQTPLQSEQTKSISSAPSIFDPPDTTFESDSYSEMEHQVYASQPRRLYQSRQLPAKLELQPTIEKLGTVDEEDSPEERIVTGSVVEFAFGDSPQSYLATSYPYRVEFAEKSDIRTLARSNVPYVVEKLAQIKPRYVMNVAIRSPALWFMYCYRWGRHTYTYDSKWFPSKPPVEPGHAGAELAQLKKEELDQISYCAFGDSPKTYFLRSTDAKKEWHPRLSQNVPPELFGPYQDELNRGTLRAVTFGKNNTWILYGTKSFRWSQYDLPSVLDAALRKGQEEGWTINKAVLNRTNPREYVLVYNEGPVYYSFHKSFVPLFKVVIEEWSAGMRRCGRFPDHVATFPSEAQSEEAAGSGINLALNKLRKDNDSDDDNVGIKREKTAGRRSHRHQMSSQSQPAQAASPSHSSVSSTSDRYESAGLQRPRASSDNPVTTDHNLPRSPVIHQSDLVRRHSYKTP